jgi:hypothetical protein
VSVVNLAASVQARLQNHARTTKRPFHELLQYYAMERFLYRLSTTPHRARFVLKGALMLHAANLRPRHRPAHERHGCKSKACAIPALYRRHGVP